ncbi:YlmC/YmxH family sporulation protein [Salsuginibacillus kocurii]|uniref:YlmC/YmxH family sporulation protein n=1 Tax=Salsuginibacillus kocurii TaxID=427078 RepID=UPI00035C77D7|nr:YlmC/YmxH family sporulation protein [Salsuginibacillus kocurii]
MRLSEIGSKEIVDFTEGGRLGVPGKVDAWFDPSSGYIHSFLFPTARKHMFQKDTSHIEITWNELKTMGEDMIIIEKQ